MLTYDDWKANRDTAWKTEPISPVCEFGFGPVCYCGNATDFAYPVHGSGWMALCAKHAEKHKPHIWSVCELIYKGETFAGVS